MSNEKQKCGQIGEEIAVKLLTGKGYEIVERNYRYGHGEIDIIAREGKELVFVEVKTRNNLEYGDPEYAVTKKKQRQVRKMAELYLYDKGIEEADCRIDVVAILMENGKDPVINHIINAF